MSGSQGGKPHSSHWTAVSKQNPTAKPPRFTVERLAQTGLLVAVLALSVHAWYYFPFLSDDALISLRYADRLVDGLGLTWTDGERVEGYTDLLWVLLTAALHFLGVDLIAAARALAFLGCLVGVLVTSLDPETKKPSLDRLLTGGLGLALCAPVAIWAVGALEHGFMVGVIACALFLLPRADRESTPGRATWLASALMAALVLLRADGAVLVFGMVLPTLFIRTPGALKRFSLLAGVPVLTVVAQHLFRYSYYGEWVPNTALAKVAMNQERMLLGVRHVGSGLLALWPSLAATAVALAAGVRFMRAVMWAPALFTFGVWSVYLAAMGGDIFPGWRQLLLGLVPLYFLLAQAVAALTVQYRSEQWSLRLGAVVVALLSLSTQSRDSENRRGKSERWEWAGASVGPALKQAFGAQRPLLAVDAAGALPFWSELPSLDMLGLNDSYLAHHPPESFGHGGIGHELGNGAYVLSRKPDLIAFNNAQGDRNPVFLSGRQMIRTKEFRRHYSLMQLRGVGVNPSIGEIYVRKSGKVGFRYSGEVTEIPGYFLSQGNAPAAIAPDGTLVTWLEPGTAARLELNLEPGNYRLTAQSSVSELELAVRCNGSTMNGTPSSEPIIAAGPRSVISIHASSPAQRAFLQSVRLEKVAQAPSLRCSRNVVRTTLDALRHRKPENSAWDAPSNVVFSRGQVAVALPATSHARVALVSMDNNDDYDFEFYAKGTKVGAVRVGPKNNGGGLANHRLQVPASVQQGGYDEIRVRGRNGDGVYSLGHLVLE